MVAVAQGKRLLPHGPHVVDPDNDGKGFRGRWPRLSDPKY